MDGLLEDHQLEERAVAKLEAAPAAVGADAEVDMLPIKAQKSALMLDANSNIKGYQSWACCAVC